MALVRPFRLQPGMTVAVVSPSSAIRSDNYSAGLQHIKDLGYEVLEAPHLFDKHGYLAGTDAARAADLDWAFSDPRVDAIICSRGGYGAGRIVEMVDWAQAARSRRALVGYSDITMLNLALEIRAGMVSFHGPMVGTLGGCMSSEAEASLWRTLTAARPMGEYRLGDAGITALRGGQADGELAGGCLTLLASACGTVDHPRLAGRIVAIEDVGEPPYRIDRMLRQLINGAGLTEAAGIVIADATESGEDPGHPLPITMDHVWRELARSVRCPVIRGFPFGHIDSPVTLPMGVRARLDADAGSLELLEPAVS